MLGLATYRVEEDAVFALSLSPAVLVRFRLLLVVDIVRKKEFGTSRVCKVSPESPELEVGNRRRCEAGERVVW